jgi:hypothetical protein
MVRAISAVSDLIEELLFRDIRPRLWLDSGTAMPSGMARLISEGFAPWGADMMFQTTLEYQIVHIVRVTARARVPESR